MRLTGMLLVVAVATVILNWYRPFEGACGGFVLAVFLLVHALLRRARTAEFDADPDLVNDELLNDEPSVRELALGALTGVLWLIVTTAVVLGLSNTRVHGWFFDEQGEAFANELDVLARNRAWNEIVALPDRPTSAHMSLAARARVDRDRYLAMANLAATLSDAGARCDAARTAESFAETHGIDPPGRLPVTCQPASNVSRAQSGSHIRLLTRTADVAGRTVISVSVADPQGAAVVGLGQGSFAAIEGGREVPIAEVAYAPSVSPPNLILLVVAPAATSARTVAAVRGLLTGIVRDRDHVETVDCSAHCDLATALLNASNRLGTQPGALILLTRGDEFPSPGSASSLLSRLRRATVPLHVLMLGRGGAASQWENIANRSGGSCRETNLTDLRGLRVSLAASVIGEGTYLLVLEGRHNRAEVALK